MNASDSATRLSIKKYSNRRFYDTTRSRHVTLGEMHDLICAGHDLDITDSKSGQDITHLILTQIILERDPPKLSIFPAEILHQIIRTQQKLLGNVVEQFFAQVLAAHRASQDQWSRFLRNTLGFEQPSGTGNPMEWTRTFVEAIMPPNIRDPRSAPEGRDRDDREREISDLRDRVAELSHLVEQLRSEEGAG